LRKVGTELRIRWQICPRERHVGRHRCVQQGANVVDARIDASCERKGKIENETGVRIRIPSITTHWHSRAQATVASVVNS